jgi:cysteine sulfinate desulfinase/cysteine desulfurase-like protein/rhodanese-related sulfurtransferase
MTGSISGMRSTDIYLDANATTPVLAEARAAALEAMDEAFANPSSTHSAGLRARARMDAVRACARRVLGAPEGQLLFNSGATEGIQTAVLSALTALRGRLDIDCVLIGATEHKAVHEALTHWSHLLRLELPILTIPVGRDGRHDLAWLRARAPRAGLVCTMAANNETGVVSDLDGIAQVLADSPALWLVDGVQALGKLPLALAQRRIDYAPFSGHKLHAPKGIGLLYVRPGAPFTPLITGGGQEDALRSGTENMPGIAAFGAVLAALEQGRVLRDAATLEGWRDQLAAALADAFPGLVFNAPLAQCLPTTLNFSVPGLGSSTLLNLFDAAGIHASGGSACSSGKAEPSHVLTAMGVPSWQAGSAVRLSFGLASDADFIAQACARIRACGAALRVCGAPSHEEDEPLAHLLADGDTTTVQKLDVNALHQLSRAQPGMRLVDVREPYEQHFADACARFAQVPTEAMPLSRLLEAVPGWLALPPETPLVFFCRSGNRSARAAAALRRLGRSHTFSVAGGLALWPSAEAGL